MIDAEHHNTNYQGYKNMMMPDSTQGHTKVKVKARDKKQNDVWMQARSYECECEGR